MLPDPAEERARNHKNTLRILEQKEDEVFSAQRELSLLCEEYSTAVNQNTEILSRFASMDPQNPTSATIHERISEVAQHDFSILANMSESIASEKRLISIQKEEEITNFYKEMAELCSEKKV